MSTITIHAKKPTESWHKVVKSMSKPSKTQRVTKVCFTLHWNCWQILFVWRPKKMSASFQAICRPLGFSWTRENYQLNINDTDVGSRKQYLGLLTLLALLCSGNSSEFYFLDELYGNELVFVLSFFSSNNTDVETAEQFILLYTRYVSDFSSPQLWKLKEKIYIVLCFIRDLPGFLLLTHDEFFDAFHWKKFRLKTVCLFRRLTIGQFIRKSCFLDRLFACCWLKKVVNFFSCEDCWLSFCAFGVSWRLK